MSSFKRRVNPAAAAATTTLPAGVKPSSFSSPVPLVSTGVPALDDLLSGGGLSSGSNLLIIPASGTAAQSAAHLGASSSTPSASAETDHAARAVAEPYAELLLGYSVAQGIASGHNGVVIGEDVDGLVTGLMARAGDLDEQLVAQLGPSTSASSKEEAAGPSDNLNTVNDEDEAESSNAVAQRGGESSEQREREMQIAWRYHDMKQFNTTVNEPSAEPVPFCQTFDLSKRIDGRILQHSRSTGKLDTIDIGDLSGGNSYEVAYDHIEKAAERCRQALGSNSTPPVLRIAIRALGSPAWRVGRGQAKHVEVVRFLNRLKRLLRSLSLVDSSSPTQRTTPIPAIAVITISSFLLTPSPSSPQPVNLAHRLVHSSDAAVSMSAFSTSPSLRTTFAAYTGAFKVLKTPSIGTLTNPSIRSSVLRGMGTGAGSGKGGEGGAGGGENNLAFKVRRKRMVIETLHLDIEGGVSERRTKPVKSLAGAEKAATSSSSSTTTTTSTPAANAIRNVTATEKESGGKSATSFVRKQPQTTATEASAGSASGKPKFGGLASLRQRGLAANAAAAGQNQPQAQAQKEYAVELDTCKHPHRHKHNQTSAPANRVANTRAQGLEF